MPREHVRMNRCRRAVVTLSALLTGCTTPNPRSCIDGFCSDQAFPFCDVDGSFEGSPLTCIAVDCEPRAFERCRADEEIVCNATGDDYDIASCAFGCNESRGGCNPCMEGSADCGTRIIPKYLPDICEQLATEPELRISDITFDTDLDINCNGGVVAQTTGPALCVVRYGSITLERDQTMRVTGDRALALVADNELTIDGTLDVSADGPLNGPGGGTVLSHDTAPPPGSGGGGAGAQTAGGAGGSANADGGAFNGGPPTTHPALLTELIGGPRPNMFAGGGGAFTAISCRGRVSILGVIDAGGGGGSGGYESFYTDYAATGGGAGGTVVLQGMRVEVSGEVYANGGGGGAGKFSPALAGRSGADGTRSALAAAPGGVAEAGAGSGGAGGRRGALPEPGRKHTAGNTTSGAGGGSVGFLLTYTPAGVTPVLPPVTASPAFEPNQVIPTR